MQPATRLASQARSYRPKWWIRIFALFFLSFSLAGLTHLWGDILSSEGPPNTAEIVVPALLVLVGFYLVVYFFTSAVTIFPDAIELRTLWSTKKLSLDQIRGRRESEITDAEGLKTQYIKLEPLDSRQPALELQRFFNFDDKFYEWINRVPDLKR